MSDVERVLTGGLDRDPVKGCISGMVCFGTLSSLQFGGGGRSS
jgi:hypothetical protein